MFRPRLIPVLLLNGSTLVKSIQFKKYKYIGDPINAVRIYNDLKADELVFLDINATKENRIIPLEFVSKLSEETNMPFAVGGGIKSLDDIQKIIKAGAEKVIIGSQAVKDPMFVKKASEAFGSSTIVVCIDVKRKLFKGNKVHSNSGKSVSVFDPVSFAKMMEDYGAGEVIIQSIDRDGMMEGYDIGLVQSIGKTLTIPVVALGGAGSLEDFRSAYHEGYASGIGAGSMFVYQSKKRGVLVNYPEREDLESLFFN
jgi:cyclase